MNIKREFNKLNVFDHYVINDMKLDAFNHIFDIGANIGLFTTIARIRFPMAKIYAFEPANDNISEFQKNTKMFSDVFLYKKALGNGGPVSLANPNARCCNYYFENDPNGNIETITLLDMFRINNVNPSDNVFLKIDCEGGERVLLSEEYNDIIRVCKQMTIEIHFKGDRYPRPDYYLNFEDYQKWINSFTSTHNIKYHVSSKHQGYGHYILKKK